MARRKTNPAESLGRFMYGIYDYYTDRGMPSNTAKARMVKESLEECLKLIKQEKEIPDALVLIMAQSFSRLLNSRGADITKEIKSSSGTVTQEDIQPLTDLKVIKDAVDVFIQNYKGWSVSHDEEKRN